jgi:5-methylcytosine-specific restriction enzyme subunit McrC
VTVRRWTIREHSTLALDADGPSVAQADALFEAGNSAKKHQHALHWKTRTSLIADRHVGIIAIPGAQIEVLPKLETINNDDADRINLVRMLQRCGDIPFVGGDAASSDWQGTDLLELFARCYLQALVREARRGLPRTYIREEDDLTALRGRWNQIRQYSVLAARPNRLACAYDEFSLDTPLNQMLKAAARVVRFAIASPSVQALAFEGESWLETVSDLSPREALALNPLLDRTNNRLQDLLRWARLFLQGARQDMRGGETHGFRILFDMAEVFERYAVTQIRTRYQPEGWSITPQGGLLNMVADAHSGAQAFQTKPDIILRRGADTWIIDTKWKRLEPPFDAKHGVAQSDLYQMAAYARRYQAQKVILLYPHWSGLGFDEGLLKTWKLLPGSAGDCVLDVATLALP